MRRLPFRPTPLPESGKVKTLWILILINKSIPRHDTFIMFYSDLIPLRLNEQLTFSYVIIWIENNIVLPTYKYVLDTYKENCLPLFYTVTIFFQEDTRHKTLQPLKILMCIDLALRRLPLSVWMKRPPEVSPRPPRYEVSRASLGQIPIVGQGLRSVQSRNPSLSVVYRPLDGRIKSSHLIKGKVGQ